MATELIKNNTENRYELIIDGKLIGYSQGHTETRHMKGAITLKNMAEEKGHTVILGEGVEINV